MKKRKPPIVLGALFVVLFGTVLAINASSLPPTEAELAAQAKERSEKAAERAKAQRAKSAEQFHRDGADSDAKFTNVKKVEAIPKGAPKLVKPIDFEARQKKKLNPEDHFQANGQWYTENSGVSGK